MKRAATIAGMALMVAAVTPAQAAYQYIQIGPGPTIEYAQAYCENAAMGVGQGVWAYGSPSYVLGAQLGNAIGNAILQDRFMTNCLVMNGWKRVRVSAPATHYKTNFNSGLESGHAGQNK